MSTFPLDDDSHLADALALAQDPEYFDKLDASAGISTIGPGKKPRFTSTD